MRYLEMVKARLKNIAKEKGRIMQDVLIRLLKNACACLVVASLLLSIAEKPMTVSCHEDLNSYNFQADSYVFINETKWSSTGKFYMNWVLEPGDSGCSGVEVAGRDGNGDIVVLAELPVTTTEYQIKGAAAFAYEFFIVQPYIQDGTERIYGQSAECENRYYGGGYFISDGIVGVKYPSQAQIRKMYKKLNPKDKKNKFKQFPKNKKPYGKGVVANSTLKNGLNTLNFVRYVAGISSNVEIKKEYQSKAQAAAVVNYNDKTSVISHYPSKPSGMSNSLYKLGASGASSSNIAAGYSSLYDGIVHGWMSDSKLSNIDRVGHRRWCLNPSMKYTGFGIDANIYTMYCFDKSGSEEEVHGVHWPAQNTPLNFFHKSDAWSISMGIAIDNPKKVKVTLTRKRGNKQKQWVFTSKNKDRAGKFMSVDNTRYGQNGCIIFRPKSIDYKKGDCFSVKISGTEFSFSYKVKFFSL